MIRNFINDFISHLSSGGGKMSEKDYVLGYDQLAFVRAQRDMDGNLIDASCPTLPQMGIPDWENISALVQAAINTELVANNWRAIN